MRTMVLFVVVVICLTILPVRFFPAASLLTVSPASAQDNETDVAAQTISAINFWRVNEGLWPLVVNPTLQQLALDQAQYLASLPDIPDDIHLGPGGVSPQGRARAAGWPTYNNPQQIAIGENGYVGANTRRAMNYWENSAWHRRAMSNPAYREIGVGVVPHPLGHIFIVVFGGRPNVLTTPADPINGLLYLTDEEFQWATGDRWIKDVTAVQLYDGEGRPMTGWIPWERTLPLPDSPFSRLYVAYSNGSIQVISVVDLSENVVLLPETLALIEGASTVAEPEPELEPEPFNESQVTVIGNNPPAEPETSAVAVATAPEEPPASADTAGADTPQAATSDSDNVQQPAGDPPPPPPGPEITIVYTARTLTVLNNSGEPVDLSGIMLESADGGLAASRWQSFSGVALSSYPSGHCLQVYGWNETGDVPLPSGCNYLDSVINIDPARRFWRSNAFEVRLGDTVLARCAVGGGECTVRLPAPGP
ncbi:MAG: CAP domain-containing protein [Chloroflexi bacterium]|nr:CAP domain-containing protein [Chloroflexota bacterium]